MSVSRKRYCAVELPSSPPSFCRAAIALREQFGHTNKWGLSRLQIRDEED